jgi:pyrroline-5-carboxylate reductase
MNKKIAIIGGGNLGVAMAEGLVSSGFVTPGHLIVTKRNISTLKGLEEKGVLVSNNNIDAVQYADWIVLAVKPFQIKEVLALLQPHLDPKRHVLISVVTGIWIKDMQEIIGESFPIFRAMPNTAIAIQESMTCICAYNADKEQMDFVTGFFDQLGKSVFIEEGGIEIGFSAATASLIAAQTVKGAAELLLQRNTHPEQEIDKVTTPKGCTIAGLNEMEHQGFSSSLIKGIVTSYRKIVNDM